MLSPVIANQIQIFTNSQLSVKPYYSNEREKRPKVENVNTKSKKYLANYINLDLHKKKLIMRRLQSLIWKRWVSHSMFKAKLPKFVPLDLKLDYNYNRPWTFAKQWMLKEKKNKRKYILFSTLFYSKFTFLRLP